MAQVGYRYSVSQRVFIYDSYVRTKSARTVRRLFQEKFPDVQVPGRTSIHRLVNKLRTTGSLLDKKRNKPRTVLTQETVSNIGNALERSPTKSLRRLAQEMEISYGSVRTGTKLLKSNGQFPKQVPEVLGQRREAVSTSGVIYVSKKTSNDRASTAKKVKRSNRSKNREMLVPEIKCEIEEGSIEFDESRETSGAEYSSGSCLASEVKSEPLSDGKKFQ
ncbi:uncharacterized protein [Anabrus simplex]|uniref:uncharacterized protein isoform X6 n=1 Tax=Anabrus simplex TaxID=316456 RepID=UPI0035A28DE0